MSSQFSSVKHAYQQLSSLYKNPTRNGLVRIDGVAAPNVNDELMIRYKSLLGLFLNHPREQWPSEKALYYTILALLYEVEDYFGIISPVRDAVVELCTAKRRLLVDGQIKTTRSLIEQFEQRREADGSTPFERADFTDPNTRSEFKAKIRCCVAAIENRRREANLDDLADELDILETFVRKNLHLYPQNPDYPAWTTLAFVLSAQARLARQAENYEYSQKKLREEVYCLDKRAAEIISFLFDRQRSTKLSDQEIESLKDDLVFIRRKQTLSSFFNVGLAALQRGFLKTANHACRSARLQFRLHGLFFQEVFNDLIILSIKRARTYNGERAKFLKLKDKLEADIIPHLDPDKGIGNPKLFLYSLRELAVLQYYCQESEEMLKTLERMESVMKNYRSFSDQWQSRINNQRARAFWRDWVREPANSAFDAALDHAQSAFSFACDRNQSISDYPDAASLCKAIKRSKRTSLIDTIESLITYGSIRASAKQFVEAVKSATAVIQLSRDYNPRLCAMGYLIRAEAYAESDHIVEAQRDAVRAHEHEKSVDHRYVEDRRKAVIEVIEKRLPQHSLFLGDLDDADFEKKGKHRLLGWFIATRTGVKSKSEVMERLGLKRHRLESYLEYLKNSRSDPYHYLYAMLSKRDADF